MPSVEEGIQSQLRNIEKDYRRTIDELVVAVNKSGLTKHNEVVAMLKQRYGMSHGASSLAGRAKPGSAAGSRGHRSRAAVARPLRATP